MQQAQYNQTIFRVQDKEGRGPWRPGFSHNWVISRPDHDFLIPPDVEHLNCLELMYQHKHVGIGCRTIPQLKRWITKNEYKKLLKYGYQVGFFKDCNIVLESDIQTVFSKEEHLSRGFNQVRLY